MEIQELEGNDPLTFSSKSSHSNSTVPSADCLVVQSRLQSVSDAHADCGKAVRRQISLALLSNASRANIFSAITGSVELVKFERGPLGDSATGHWTIEE